MMRYWRKILAVLGILYIILLCFSEQRANLYLSYLAVASVPFLIYLYINRNSNFEDSIKHVPIQFVSGNNTLANDQCIVQFFPNDKIIVSENISGSRRRMKRVFTIRQISGANINKNWNEICRFFDALTYFEMLGAYFTMCGNTPHIGTVLDLGKS